MKNIYIYSIFILLNWFTVSSQTTIDNYSSDTYDAIEQIQTSGKDNIMIFQNQNQGFNNHVSTQQIGNQNTAIINQQNVGSSSKSNQSFTIQEGNSNELNVDQMGSGNLLLGFQLSYLSLIVNNSQGNQNVNSYTYEHNTSTLGEPVLSENNKIKVQQNGNNNGVMAIQQGTDNTISAEQIGNNNYLLALQSGSNNSITGYTQENESDHSLYDRIIQVGDNLTVETEGVSNSKSDGNLFKQTGKNLTIQINNDLLNSIGGIEIDQKGNDMTIKIDQSYFSFPMK